MSKTRKTAKQRANEFLDDFEEFVANDKDEPSKPLEIPTSKIGAKKDTVLARKLPVLEIEPSKCRPWRHHNRDAGWLTPESCGDLISSISSHGQQEPSLVRKLENDPDYDYEIIYGVRRWYACSQIPGKKLLARKTDASDRDCMILMHIENADSKDISEMERALSFREHLRSGEFKSQQDLCKAINISEGWLSRCLTAVAIYDYDWLKPFLPPIQKISLRKGAELGTFLKDRFFRQHIKTLCDQQKNDVQKVSSTKLIEKFIGECRNIDDSSKVPVELPEHSLSGLTMKIDSRGNLIVKISPKVKKDGVSKAKQVLDTALDAYSND